MDAVFSDSVTSDGSFGIVVRDGDSVPGRPASDQISVSDLDSHETEVVQGAGGHVLVVNAAVGIEVPGGNVRRTSGLFLRSPDPNAPLETIHLLRSGQDIKSELGPASGLALAADQYETLSSHATVNARGQVAFLNFLTAISHQDLVESNDPSASLLPVTGGALYATDLNGVLHNIARTGQLFDVNDDPLVEEFREIVGLSAGADNERIFGAGGTSLQSGGGTFFNDAGQLAFTATFTDGTSGVFVVSTFTIPEPGSLALLSLGGVALLGRRRRSA